MRRFVILFILIAFILALGCYGMNREQQTTLSGAAVGAVGGGLVGAFSGGDPAVGAVVGAGIGGITGYILGEQGERHEHYRR
ncbi:MAG TPA: glycine zipper domain-containing protein [Dissulfurispiraceae bacterium]|nr:glycine zipper domain-containing protein [Dissulfurispiraceae bacterium]